MVFNEFVIDGSRYQLFITESNQKVGAPFTPSLTPKGFDLWEETRAPEAKTDVSTGRTGKPHTGRPGDKPAIFSWQGNS